MLVYKLKYQFHVTRHKDVILFYKYFIEYLKFELIIPNILCYILFCNRFKNRDTDCTKCTKTYVHDNNLNRFFETNFGNI